MAFNTRFRPRFGPQRPKLNGDENAIVNKQVKTSSLGGPIRVPIKSGPQRPALGKVPVAAVNKIQSAKFPSKGFKDIGGPLKRARSATLDAATGARRVPLGPVRPTVNNATSNTATAAPAKLPLRPQRPNLIPKSKTAPELGKPLSRPEPQPKSKTKHELEQEDDETEDELDAKEASMEVEEEEAEVRKQVTDLRSSQELVKAGEETEEEAEEDEEDVPIDFVWPELSPRAKEKYRREIEQIRETFKEEIDVLDMTMVSEYADEIFDYMSKLEVEMMPNPDYIQGQSEITWDMRQALVDWLLQVHLRYHLLPETLWIAINLVDRFLSRRVVSIVKLQLVGVTAMFIASKYEETLAPSVDEFVFLTNNSCNREEILRGERIVMKTIDFKISSYCSPYSWMRRISKADNYDIQTRTLAKYLTEVTLLDHRFLRIKPSLVAAIGMYTARRMLERDWDKAFMYYSGYTEEQLLKGHNRIIEKLLEHGFGQQHVSKKYASKKFLRASVFAIDWARKKSMAPVIADANEMALEA